jgi:hypothetical protein
MREAYYESSAQYSPHRARVRPPSGTRGTEPCGQPAANWPLAGDGTCRLPLLLPGGGGGGGPPPPPPRQARAAPGPGPLLPPAPMHPVSVRRGPGSGRIWPVPAGGLVVRSRAFGHRRSAPRLASTPSILCALAHGLADRLDHHRKLHRSLGPGGSRPAWSVRRLCQDAGMLLDGFYRGCYGT